VFYEVTFNEKLLAAGGLGCFLVSEANQKHPKPTDDQ